MKADTLTTLHLSPESLNQSSIEHTRAGTTFCPVFTALLLTTSSSCINLTYPYTKEIKFLFYKGIHGIFRAV